MRQPPKGWSERPGPWGYGKKCKAVLRRAAFAVEDPGHWSLHFGLAGDVDPADAAGLLIAMVEGYASLAKNAQGPKVMKAGSETWASCGPCARRATAGEVDRIGVSRNSLAMLHSNRFVC
jgi:hypothetical protein